MKLNHEEKDKIILAIRNGASIHQVSSKWKLTIEQAQEWIDHVAKETREGACQHRIVLRSLLREQAPMALKTLVELASASVDAETSHELQVLNLRFKAADKILQYATKFMTEDIPTSAVEQGKAEEMIQTIFDFESVVLPDGATTLIAKPALRLVENE
jgi:hypothetical protein